MPLLIYPAILAGGWVWGFFSADTINWLLWLVVAVVAAYLFWPQIKGVIQ